VNTKERGMLYLVSTPIGNLEDISLRALRILAEVDIIAAEDTRRTGLLLKHFGIQNRMESYHEHNKARKSTFLLTLCDDLVAVKSEDNPYNCPTTQQPNSGQNRKNHESIRLVISKA